MAAQNYSKISKAKARLLLEHPFFATLLLRTKVKVADTSDHGCPVLTAATDGQAIYINPDMYEKSTVDQLMSDLAHEVGHDSLLHSLRLGTRQQQLFNIAADHTINIMLEDQGFKVPPGGWLADKQYKGWSADKIYDDLRRKQKEDPKGGGSSSPGAGKSGGQGNQPGSGQHLPGDVLPAPKMAAAEQAKAEQKAKQRVAAAATAARLAGKLTGDLARMVDEMLDPKVHWTDVLREYMTRIVKARDNWSRRNRRFAQFYLPTRRSQQMGPIVFIPDTSGSMMGDDMERICSEMAHCAQQTQPENIRVIWTDAAVKGEQVFSPGEFAFSRLEPKGGGGTDMRVGLKYAEQYDPQIVVLLTDCYTPWPDVPCPFPVICISTTPHGSPDWMERIEI